MPISREKFEDYEFSQVQNRLFAAQREAVKTFLSYDKNEAFMIEEIADALNFEVHVVQSALFSLSYRWVTRRGKYFIWKK